MSLLDYLTRPAAPAEPEAQLPGKWVTEDGLTRYLTPAEVSRRQQEQRAAVDAANARIDAQRQQERDERERRRQEHHAQTAAADEQEARRAVRLRYAGTDAEFDAAWPAIWRELRQQRAIDADQQRTATIAQMARRF